MSFHEVPEDLDALDEPVTEGVSVAVLCIALDHLLASVAAAPEPADPGVAAVHVGGVLLGPGSTCC